MLAVVVIVSLQFSVPEFTVTHLLLYLHTFPLCWQRNVQRSEQEYWLYFSGGYFSTWLWIRTSILSCGAIPQDLCRSLIFYLPIGREILWQLFFEQLYNFCYWVMRLNICRPSGLLAQEHSDSFKPPRHMLTFLVVYSCINCPQDQYIWFDLRTSFAAIICNSILCVS